MPPNSCFCACPLILISWVLSFLEFLVTQTISTAEISTSFSPDFWRLRVLPFCGRVFQNSEIQIIFFTLLEKKFSGPFHEVRVLQNQGNKCPYRKKCSRCLDMESVSGLCPKWINHCLPTGFIFWNYHPEFQPDDWV